MFTDKIHWFDVIDSTNSEAYRSLLTALHGTVWTARFQSAGRGQRGNKWESAAGENLMFSILLRPRFLPAERQFLISQIAALALCDLLDSWGLEATIKWPNDIYIGDKKIQGMLIEHFVNGAELSASIVGIGINLNQTRFESDAPNPTSVLLETGQKSTPKEVLMLLLDGLERRYNQGMQGDLGEITDAYCARLYRLHQWTRFLRCTDQTEFEGFITGVDPYGCLIMTLTDGGTEVFSFQEIRYVL
jgi:BirA family biotin operon repressor/biotin-[acetyl-CoA-carboxylase] ligase